MNKIIFDAKLLDLYAEDFEYLQNTIQAEIFKVFKQTIEYNNIPAIVKGFNLGISTTNSQKLCITHTNTFGSAVNSTGVIIESSNSIDGITLADTTSGNYNYVYISIVSTLGSYNRIAQSFVPNVKGAIDLSDYSKQYDREEDSFSILVLTQSEYFTLSSGGSITISSITYSPSNLVYLGRAKALGTGVPLTAACIDLTNVITLQSSILPYSITSNMISPTGFSLDQSKVSSTPLLNISDSYSGTPSTTIDDLNQVRTSIKEIKGTAAWDTPFTTSLSDFDKSINAVHENGVFPNQYATLQTVPSTFGALTAGTTFTGTGVALNTTIVQETTVFTGYLSNGTSEVPGNTLVVTGITSTFYNGLNTNSGVIFDGLSVSASGMTTANIITQTVGVTLSGTIPANSTTLTVSAVTTGTITIGVELIGINLIPGTTITSFISGINGGAGTYTISLAPILAATVTEAKKGVGTYILSGVSQAIGTIGSPATFTATGTGVGTGGAGKYHVYPTQTLSSSVLVGSASFTFTGSISGVTLTVLTDITIANTTNTIPLLKVGTIIAGAGVTVNTIVTDVITTIVGGNTIITYTVSNSCHVSSIAMTGKTITPIMGTIKGTVLSVTEIAPSMNIAIFTGHISGTVLTVTSITSGSIVKNVTLSGTGITTGTTITAIHTGTTGGTGTYTVSVSQTVSSTTITTSIPHFQVTILPGLANINGDISRVLSTSTGSVLQLDSSSSYITPVGSGLNNGQLRKFTTSTGYNSGASFFVYAGNTTLHGATTNVPAVTNINNQGSSTYINDGYLIIANNDGGPLNQNSTYGFIAGSDYTVNTDTGLITLVSTRMVDCWNGKISSGNSTADRIFQCSYQYGYARYDVIAMGSSNSLVQFTGTPSATPLVPDTNNIVLNLAYIFVKPFNYIVKNSDITDTRSYINQVKEIIDISALTYNTTPRSIQRINYYSSINIVQPLLTSTGYISGATTPWSIATSSAADTYAYTNISGSYLETTVYAKVNDQIWLVTDKTPWTNTITVQYTTPNSDSWAYSTTVDLFYNTQLMEYPVFIVNNLQEGYIRIRITVSNVASLGFILYRILVGKNDLFYNKHSILDSSYMIPKKVTNYTGNNAKLYPYSVSQGFQEWGFNSVITLTSATGLANNSTSYGITLAVNGGVATAINILGSAAQTIGTLITALNAAITANSVLTGLAVVSFDNTGNGFIKITSNLSGAGSTIAIVDANNLFSSLILNSIRISKTTVETAVPGGIDNTRMGSSLLQLDSKVFCGTDGRQLNFTDIEQQNPVSRVSAYCNATAFTTSTGYNSSAASAGPVSLLTTLGETTSDIRSYFYVNPKIVGSTNHQRVAIYFTTAPTLTQGTVSIIIHDSSHNDVSSVISVIASAANIVVGYNFFEIPATLISGHTYHYHIWASGTNVTLAVQSRVSGVTSDKKIYLIQFYTPTAGLYPNPHVFDFIDNTSTNLVPTRASGLNLSAVVAGSTGGNRYDLNTLDVMAVDFSNLSNWYNWEYDPGTNMLGGSFLGYFTTNILTIPSTITGVAPSGTYGQVNVGSNLTAANCASFTGTITTPSTNGYATLSVTALSTGTILQGASIYSNTGVLYGTVISYSTGSTYGAGNGGVGIYNILTPLPIPSALSVGVSGVALTSSSTFLIKSFGNNTTGGLGTYNLSYSQTAPSTTITGINSSYMNNAVFSGYISTTTLTVTSVTSGTVIVGMVLSGSGVTAGTTITAGSGTSFTVSTSQTAGLNTSPITITGVSGITFSATIATTVLTVTSVPTGTLVSGFLITGAGVSSGTILGTQISGTTGGTGTYNLNISQTVSVAVTMTASTPTTFTGSISTSTLTVTNVSNGTLFPGMLITSGSSMTAVTITAQLTGTGLTGTYTVTGSQTVGPITMYGYQVPVVTGTIASGTPNVLTVTGNVSGVLNPGTLLTGGSITPSAPAAIASQVTGSYTILNPNSSSSSTQTITGISPNGITTSVTGSISGTTFSFTGATLAIPFGPGFTLSGSGVNAGTIIVSQNATGNTYNLSGPSLSIGTATTFTGITPVVMTGGISGTTLIVSALNNTGNPIMSGAYLAGLGFTTGNGTIISSFGTGTGGIGTYNLTFSQTIGSSSSLLTITAPTATAKYIGVDLITGRVKLPKLGDSLGTGYSIKDYYITFNIKEPNSQTDDKSYLVHGNTIALDDYLHNTQQGSDISANGVINGNFDVWQRVQLGTPISYTSSSISGTILTLGTVSNTVAISSCSFTSATFTVTTVTSGVISVGTILTGTNITAGTYVTALGTGTGQAGTYTVSTTTCTATSGVSGYVPVVIGSTVTGTGVLSGTVILNQITGTTGVAGTYTVNLPQNVTSTTITCGPAAGQFLNVQNSNYTADMMRTYISSSTQTNGLYSPVVNISKVTGNPSPNALRVQVDSFTYVSTATNCGVEYRLPTTDALKYNSKNITVSFDLRKGSSFSPNVVLNLNYLNTVSFTGSITTTTLTVTSAPTPASTTVLFVGSQITGPGVTAGTVITALGSGTGGVGTYTVNNSQSVSSTTLTTVADVFNPTTNPTFGSYTIQNNNIGPSFRRFSYTFNLSNLTSTYTNLIVQLAAPFSATITSDPNRYFDVQNIQINEGVSAVPYQMTSFNTELQKCLPFYEKSFDYTTFPGSTVTGNNIASTGNATSSFRWYNTITITTGAITVFPGFIDFERRKYIVPTVKLYSETGTANAISTTISTTSAGTDKIGCTASSISQKGISTVAIAASSVSSSATQCGVQYVTFVEL